MDKDLIVDVSLSLESPNVDVSLDLESPNVDLKVANRAGGIDVVKHDDTLVGNGDNEPLGVNVEVIATKEDVDKAVKNIDLTEYYTKEEVDGIVENIDVLPTQTGNGGKFLRTDGETTSWEKALTNNATRETYVVVGNNAYTTEDEYGSAVAIGANAGTTNNSVAVGGYAETNVAGGLAIGNNAKANNFDATTNEDQNGVAVGANAMSTNAQAIAIGGDAQSNGVKSIAIGDRKSVV